MPIRVREGKDLIEILPETHTRRAWRRNDSGSIVRNIRTGHSNLGREVCDGVRKTSPYGVYNSSDLLRRWLPSMRATVSRRSSIPVRALLNGQEMFSIFQNCETIVIVLNEIFAEVLAQWQHKPYCLCGIPILTAASSFWFPGTISFRTIFNRYRLFCSWACAIMVKYLADQLSILELV